MSRQVSSLKGLVATSCKKLETILARYKEDRLETMKVEEGDGSSEDQRACRMRIQEALGAMQECTTRIDHLLERYASAYDQLERPTKSATDEYEEYSTKAADILSEALDYTIILQGRLRTFTSNTGRGQRMPNAGELEQLSQDLIPQTKRIDLPTLPIPSFSGNVWDWDNFWILFSTNVHSQPLPEIFKFNYLLNALKGEAYNAVKKFQITNENYQKAIEFLQAKYGNKEELVQRLIVKMETTTMRSPSVKDQRVLLEQMQAIVSQLRDKGETVDSPWLIKQVLSKFPERLQRKALKRKRSMGGSFQMEDLLASLDDSISEEEMITLFTSKNNVMQQQHSQKGKPHKEQTSRGSLSCMYCGEDHKASSCTRYGTPQERANYLREHKLCLICASPQHATSDCKKRPCFACQGKHHTSCCFKAMTTPETSTPRQGKPTASAKPNERLKFAKNTNPTSAATHQLSNQEEDHISSRTNAQEDSVTQLHSSEGRPSTRETYLPIGELTIMDPSSRELRKVTALLDSGAECSFIDHKLAEELRLPTLGTTTLRVRTFGSDRVQECVSRKVPLEMWDHEGKPWSLELLTHETLTSTLRTPPVLEEDVAFIKSQNINVNLVEAQEAIKPLILLGSDQLWQLIRHDEAHICLPSGLYLLPTRLGHLLTGQVQGTYHHERDRSKQAVGERDQSSLLETDINAFTIEDPTEVVDEQVLWERRWTKEQEADEDFAQPEKDVQSIIDKKVLDGFRDTVQKRQDGYYVRLPWKEIPVMLPDNRAIALRRLDNVWKSLSKDMELLDKYNETFVEQQRLNVIEPVDEGKEVEGTIHYLPHQAVLTPHKSTTKLRIVFDASAHYKNCPSLNDALHRGPVLLPKLYGLLLRFRIGRVALISDVEKAFLQVRLQEVDRDATRCLWLRDHKEPPSKDNLRVYRFTRVTFGLLPSPFLLAATTYYHLDQYSKETKLGKEIKDNLYVDNLLVTTDTAEEGLRVYYRTKAIFNELKMNLREFASNDETVMETIPTVDKSTEEDPKVLGIKWNKSEDQFQIACTVIRQPIVTKRTVARAIASVYDPMGWMLPLILKAKLFQQLLWIDGFEWDTPLPGDRK